MKANVLFLLVALILLIGCSGSKNPIESAIYDPGSPVLTTAVSFPEDGNKKLWTYGFIHVNDDHSRWDYVPIRQLDFHFNALKFLEQGPCQNCISIEKIVHLPDGVVEVDVRIQHPFPGFLQYSAFDVKGIVMFRGTTPLASHNPYDIYSNYEIFKEHPELYPMFLNFAFAGDWELMNPDGYSVRWTPAYLSGSDAPMFKYIHGKYASSELPNSGINGFKYFYSHEERHMFLAGQAVTRTYRIQTQPGPMIIGYAVEASWVPPDVFPVTDPLVDFPISANQPEPYVERYFVNNGQPITKPKSEQTEYTRFAEWRFWDDGYVIYKGFIVPNTNNVVSQSHQGQWYRYGNWDWDIPIIAGCSPTSVILDPVPEIEGLYFFGRKENWGFKKDYFDVSGKFNAYYVYVRFSFHSPYPKSQYKPWTNWNPSIEVVQLNIPGNDY